MHHIYHTEGIILGSKNHGEASKYFYVLTRDFGMLYASADGVRKLSSRLRYVLQDYSYIKIDLIRARNFWKITSASKTGELDELMQNKNRMRVVINISRLMKRLLAGEEKNTQLFEDFKLGLLSLQVFTDMDSIRDVETVIVLRVLFHLGYIGEREGIDTLAISPLGPELFYNAGKNRTKLLREINRALRETNL